MPSSDLSHASLRDEAEQDRERRVLASAWKGAGEVLDYMLILLDPPAAIAGRKTIGRLTRQLMCDWIRNLEILVRRLLVITALALVLPPSHPAGGKRRVRELQPFVSDDPASWKVCLRLFQTPSGSRGARSCRARHDDQAEWNALPFALRLEALCRIIAQPKRRARSVARKLARIRAANTRSNAPRTFAVRYWHIHSSIITPAQDSIAGLMDGTEPLAERAFARWQEPG